MYQYHYFLSLVLSSTDLSEGLYRVLSKSSPAALCFVLPFASIFKTYLNNYFSCILYLKFMDGIHRKKDSKQSYVASYNKFRS